MSRELKTMGLVVLLLGTTFVGGCGTKTAEVTKAHASDLIINVTELDAGWAQVDATHRTLAIALGDDPPPVQKQVRAQWLSGEERTFDLDGDEVRLAIGVDIFRTVHGAEQVDAAWTSELPKVMKKDGATIEPYSFGKIKMPCCHGMSLAGRGKIAKNGPKVEVAIYTWSRGNMVGHALVVYTDQIRTDTPPLDLLREIATKQDNRFRSALKSEG